MPIVVSLCRYAIRVASLLAPTGFRAEWARDWNTEIWHGYASLAGRRGFPRESPAQTAVLCGGSVFGCRQPAALRLQSRGCPGATGLLSCRATAGVECGLPCQPRISKLPGNDCRHGRAAGTEPGAVVALGKGNGDRSGSYGRGFACLAAR